MTGVLLHAGISRGNRTGDADSSDYARVASSRRRRCSTTACCSSCSAVSSSCSSRLDTKRITGASRSRCRAHARSIFSLTAASRAAIGRCSAEGAKEALNLCDELRVKLKERHKLQRVRLWWTIGLLRDRLGHSKRAWLAFITAKRSLMALRAAPEVGALVADMARMSRKPLAVRQICHEAAEIITKGHPLVEPLHALARAAKDLIPEAAAALRREASAIAPCPAL